jgi:hypothetical protein
MPSPNLLAVSSLLAVPATPLAADVTLDTRTSGTGIGALADSTGRTMIRGHKMRTEAALGKKQLVTIFDLDAQTMILLEPGRKRAEVVDMRQLAADISRAVDPQGDRDVLRADRQDATDRRHELRRAPDLDPHPHADGGDGGALVTIVSGPVWLAQGAPGHPDFRAFYLAAAEKGWIFERPEAAKAQPGRARAMADLNVAMARAGLMCASEVTIGFEGSGPMAAIFGRMRSTLTTEVTGVSTGIARRRPLRRSGRIQDQEIVAGSVEPLAAIATPRAPRSPAARAGRCGRRAGARPSAFGSGSAAKSRRPSSTGRIPSRAPWITSTGARIAGRRRERVVALAEQRPREPAGEVSARGVVERRPGAHQ